MRQIVMLLLIGALVTAGQGEEPWWDFEWDCSIPPDQATPAWNPAPGSTDGNIWSNLIDAKWTAVTLPWENTISTVEVRVNFVGENPNPDNAGLVGCFLPKQWQAVLYPGDDTRMIDWNSRRKTSGLP